MGSTRFRVVAAGAAALPRSRRSQSLRASLANVLTAWQAITSRQIVSSPPCASIVSTRATAPWDVLCPCRSWEASGAALRCNRTEVIGSPFGGNPPGDASVTTRRIRLPSGRSPPVALRRCLDVVLLPLCHRHRPRPPRTPIRRLRHLRAANWLLPQR